MGNGLGRLRSCLSGSEDVSAMGSDLQDKGFGHSFYYVHPTSLSCSKVHHSEDAAAAAAAFISISGASVSANTATALSTSIVLSSDSPPCSVFDCSTSFSSVPLLPVPKGQYYQSGPLSGPIDRGFMSGPIERTFMSGPLDKYSSRSNLIRGLRRAISRTISTVTPAKGSASSSTIELERGNSEEEIEDGSSLQWAQGKAGEDRVHVVISEDRGWVFVGIYDGFNGPDAPDFLLSNLYSAVHSEVEGLLSDSGNPNSGDSGARTSKRQKKWEETQRKWKNEWDKERSDPKSRSTVDHAEVLRALSSALKKTEESYLDIADNMVGENPELALMGSCVLVMLMKGEDVYLMNVGDSRAVLARKAEQENTQTTSEEESSSDFDGDEVDGPPSLTALQLTQEHSTSVEEEVQRIKREHPDDSAAVMNDRVKGSLKVTRAFGAGFLKRPKWNNALLEVFRIDYVGSSAYISCNPSLCHHKLSEEDRFLILSSDGLYQYFTNEEAVAEVELFIASYPEGDPAQHLVEEVLFRAARKAGMDFHQLLEIPQGDRRKYHDDVSVIVISLEGRIWRYSV